MNVFVTETPTVEILVDAGGNIVGAQTNILPTVNVKIVDEDSDNTGIDNMERM